MNFKSKGWSKLELFVLNAVSLYVELLIIRWLSADVRMFTVFRTFPLVTCFIGLGVGMAMKSDRIFRFSILAAALTVFVIKLFELAGISYISFPSLSISQFQDLALHSMQPEHPAILALIMVCLVLLLVGPFALCACIGSRLGRLFSELPPLTAYSINISGAILGSILFSLLSCFNVAPAIFLVPVCLILASYLRREGNLIWVSLGVLALSVMLSTSVRQPYTLALDSQLKATQQTTCWSPYQRIDLSLFEGGRNGRDVAGLELGVNRCFYQYFFRNDAPQLLGDKFTELLSSRKAEYDLPFKFNHPKSVLVVGAGTGQNVQSALQQGAEYIDACDIDPVILKIGCQYNPAYSSPKVHLVCDDARHFFTICKRKYDAIVFGLLDSHATTGNGSTVRLDSYVYTKESFEGALRLLNKDGLVVLSYVNSVPGVDQRLYLTMEAAAGYPPLCFESDEAEWGGNLIMVVGDAVRHGALSKPDNFAYWHPVADAQGKVLTDDWPYLYVQPRVVDLPYLAVVLEILLLAGLVGRRTLFNSLPDAAGWQMFFLGAAFLLLELHAISFLALLYGSTWQTSALVINSILIMIFAANLMVIKVPFVIERLSVIYALLYGAIALSYLTPPAQLFAIVAQFGAAGYAIATIITIFPLCIAGIIFSGSFAHSQDPAMSLAYNLFGSLAGGLLEYLSNFTGIKALELVAALLYLCSMVAYLRARKAPSAVSLTPDRSA